MFWDIFQDSRIREAEDKVDRTRHKMDQAEEDVKSLEEKVDGLSIVCQALWELLTEHTRCTDELFQAKLQELHMAADANSNCKRCGTMKTKRSSNCPYCGVAVSKALG